MALIAAAKADQAAEVQKLISARTDILEKEADFGWTPLHVAAGNGAAAAVASLLESSAPHDARAKDGETPLHLAAGEGHTCIIWQLLACRAQVNAVNDDGETPIHVAVQHVGGKPGLSHLQALLDGGADASLRDSDGHDVAETAGVYTNRADDIRKVLLGEALLKADPEDTFPDSPGELEDGADALNAAESLRELGNRRFRDGGYVVASALYKKAVFFIPAEDNGKRAEKATACRVACKSNMAACCLKLEDYTECISLCEDVLAIDAGSAKALYRKSVALRGLGQAEEAEKILREAAEADPSNAAVKRQVDEIEWMRRKAQQTEKRMAQKMFG